MSILTRPATTLVMATLVTFTALPALAQASRELSKPIVTLTATIKKNAKQLALNEQQTAAVDEWIATMPAKRKAVEADAIAARSALRDAILAGAARDERMALAEKVAGFEAKLLMMRSDCTDHWRKELTEDQFKQAVAIMSKAGS